MLMLRTFEGSSSDVLQIFFSRKMKRTSRAVRGGSQIIEFNIAARQTKGFPPYREGWTIHD